MYGTFRAVPDVWNGGFVTGLVPDLWSVMKYKLYININIYVYCIYV